MLHIFYLSDQSICFLGSCPAASGEITVNGRKDEGEVENVPPVPRTTFYTHHVLVGCIEEAIRRFEKLSRIFVDGRIELWPSLKCEKSPALSTNAQTSPC